MQLVFDNPAVDIAELQAVALYDGDACLGGAFIRERGPTMWDETRGVCGTGWSTGIGDAYVTG